MSRPTRPHLQPDQGSTEPGSGGRPGTATGEERGCGPLTRVCQCLPE